MDLNHLRSFVAVAQFGHLTRAAEAQHLSQPALSSHIKTLEEQFGVTLFERSSSGMTLTPSGRLLLAEAEQIIAAVARLTDDRFAVWGVGDVRDDRGLYVNLPGRTVEAFEAAGARFYNEAILVTAVGSLPIRTGRQFTAARKLGRTHQSMLLFVKGDPRRATEACGEVEFGEIEETLP